MNCPTNYPLSFLDRRHMGWRRQCPTATNRTGGALALILLLTILILTLGGFAINLAQMQLVRTEMQVASDASARAANRIFASTRSLPQAQSMGQTVANNNRVNGRTLILRGSDYELGTAVRNNLHQRYQYTPGGANPNSIVLRTEMSDSSPTGPVQLFMPGFLGIDSTNITMESRSTQVELDIALVIDRSGSMAFRADQVAALPHPWNGGAPLPAGFNFGHAAPNPSRWRDTVAGIQVFLNELNQTAQLEHVALATYASGAQVDLNPTTNYGGIMSQLDSYSNGFSGGGTNIQSGLRAANNALVHANARPWAVKVIVLMTDGLRDAGDEISQARSLARDGVMIFTVTFAQEANQARMVTVANIGGGKHYHATNASSLSAVFRDIARQMPTLVTR
ncbi:MAG: VWA domain-containing protein [Planctomycetaceae bacterium]|nr:VWA domain-containing protein [Planctomycetaceae bacterium]